jgi:hypothetical protein
MVKKNSSKKNGSRSARSRPRAGGDVPAPALRTYRTVSCSIPPVTEECVVRGTQTYALAAQATAGQAPTYYASLSNFNIGTGFWDQYRIEALRFTIAPSNNAIGLVTNTTTSLVPLYCVIDYDDASALANAAAAEAYANCVTLNPGESVERVFQPRLAMAAYTGSFTGYVNMGPQWIDAASNTVQHYGIKMYIPGATAAQTLLQSWNITVEAFVRMRKAI